MDRDGSLFPVGDWRLFIQAGSPKGPHSICAEGALAQSTVVGKFTEFEGRFVFLWPGATLACSP